MSETWIVPDWPAPDTVLALTTTRTGGVSGGPWAGLNLADHVGDAPGAVEHNRIRLGEALGLPASPCWLQQVHGNRVVDAAETGVPVQADGAWTGRHGAVCAVLTADCLPVLLCDRAATRVAAVHAGWRGLAAGIIEQAVHTLRLPGRELLAWLGPAIGADAYVVGDEVRGAFVGRQSRAAAAFRPALAGGWHADLYALARLRLTACGIATISGGDCCTHRDPERFYSYRRDGVTGRMATLIWLRDR